MLLDRLKCHMDVPNTSLECIRNIPNNSCQSGTNPQVQPPREWGQVNEKYQAPCLQ
jgi:hypothetical protein